MTSVLVRRQSGVHTNQNYRYRIRSIFKMMNMMAAKMKKRYQQASAADTENVDHRRSQQRDPSTSSAKPEGRATAAVSEMEPPAISRNTSSNLSHSASIAAAADQQWTRAIGMLKNNPSLVTYHILCMALKHRPPTDVIQYMLDLNPSVASVPKTGPTPLQVAIQQPGCSLEVVKLLIQANPLALIATNPGSHLDPLSYVKRFRPEETALLQLLSYPVDHWVSSSNDAPGARSIGFLKSNEPKEPAALAWPVSSAQDLPSQNRSGSSSVNDRSNGANSGSTVPKTNRNHAAQNRNSIGTTNSSRTAPPPPPPPPEDNQSSASRPLRQRLISSTMQHTGALDHLLCVGPSPIPSQDDDEEVLEKDADNVESSKDKSKTSWITSAALNAAPTLPARTGSYRGNTTANPPLAAYHHQDREELYNVKQLCIAVVKGHKRLSRDVKGLASKIDSEHKQDHLESRFQELFEENEKQFEAHELVLHSKEKAMEGQFRRWEDRMKAILSEQRQRFERRLSTLAFSPYGESMTNQLAALETKLQQLTSLVQTSLGDLNGRVKAMEESLQAKNDRSTLKEEHKRKTQSKAMADFDASFETAFFAPSGLPHKYLEAPVAKRTSPKNGHTSKPTTPSTVITVTSSVMEDTVGTSFSERDLLFIRPHHKSLGKSKRVLDLSSTSSSSLRTPQVDPVVFCSPIMVPNHAEDDVRSLLSEDPVPHHASKAVVTHRKVCWTLLFQKLVCASK